jgi:hypothetical protein
MSEIASPLKGGSESITARLGQAELNQGAGIQMLTKPRNPAIRILQRRRISCQGSSTTCSRAEWHSASSTKSAMESPVRPD